MLEKGFTVPTLAEPSLPGAPSWFPLPPGWWILGGILLVALLVIGLFRAAKWRRNRWRREALAAIAQPQSVDSWLLLMKRILLVHQPREVIAAQTDPARWLAQIPLDNALREELVQRYCHPNNQLSDVRTTALRAQLHTWLEGLPDV